MIKCKQSFPNADEIKLGGYGGKIIDYTIEKRLCDVDTKK